MNVHRLLGGVSALMRTLIATITLVGGVSLFGGACSSRRNVALFEPCERNAECASQRCAGGEDDTSANPPSPICTVACTDHDDCGPEGTCSRSYGAAICLKSNVTHACLYENTANDDSRGLRFKCENKYRSDDACVLSREELVVTREPGRRCEALGYTVYCSESLLWEHHGYFNPGAECPAAQAGGGSSSGENCDYDGCMRVCVEAGGTNCGEDCKCK
jgi:hypothetical protein